VGFTEDKDSTRLVAQTMTATSQPVSSILLKHETFKKSTKGNTQVYYTPFEEFSILGIKGDEELEALDGPGIAIVLSGDVTIGDASEEGEGVKQPAGQAGSVYLVGAGAKLSVQGDGEVWMAFYDSETNAAGKK
jgi:mannose-6-phosphate isomerase